MTTWVLLLRAVNVGSRNKLPMADLRTLLTDLGHGEVRTLLNSGNAVFTSNRKAPGPLAAEIEKGLRDRLGLSVRATLRTLPELQAALDGLPKDIADTSYVLLAFLFDKPTATARKDVESWDVSPERLALGDGVVYIGYDGPMHASKLQNAALEKKLGVGATGRTPATVRKLLA
jgi:uncharacterized protein (DUF1697 family)